MNNNVAAPFLTPNELTSAPGDASASGVNVNFDPANKAPLQPLQDTFNRLDAENNANIQQQKQRDHDILTRQMAFDHEDKVNQYRQAMQDRQDLFNYFNKTGETSATAKDINTGADMSIPFLPEDQAQVNDATDEFQKKVVRDPSGFKTDPDAWRQWNDLKHQRINASMRSIYYKQAEQAMANSFDPQERARLKDYMEGLKKQPLNADNMPTPYIQQPSVKPLIDVEKDYKDGKGFESFDEGSGVPNARYQGLLTTTDPGMINEGFKRYQFFRNQPHGQDPEVFAQYQNQLNELTDSRDLPRIDLGGRIGPDGKLVFDDATYAKKQQLARKYLAAAELMNNGYLKNPDEEDQLKNEETRAKIRKDKAEASKLEREAITGKEAKPTVEELKERVYKKAAKAMVDNVRKVYSESVEEKHPVKPAYPEFWKRNGVNPSEYDIYPSISGSAAGKFVGIAAPETSTTTDVKGTKTTEKLPAGSISVDRIVPIRNKETKELKLAYVSDNKIVNIVPEKQAAINGLKHEDQYDPKLYENKTAWVEDALGESPAQKTTPAAASFTPKYNGAPVRVRNNGGSYEANVGGVWRKIKARNSKTGEIKV